jgi:hypothetical protein
VASGVLRAGYAVDDTAPRPVNSGTMLLRLSARYTGRWPNVLVNEGDAEQLSRFRRRYHDAIARFMQVRTRPSLNPLAPHDGAGSSSSAQPMPG